jgi:hypothetical protein
MVVQKGSYSSKTGWTEEFCNFYASDNQSARLPA